MQPKRKQLEDLLTAISRVSTISLIIMVIWVSHFWSEQKSSLNNFNISINGSSVLSSDYYIQYLVSSVDGEIFYSDPNIILDKIYEHPFIKGAKVSYRYPDEEASPGKTYYVFSNPVKVRPSLDLVFGADSEKKWDKAIKKTGIDFSKFSSTSGNA